MADMSQVEADLFAALGMSEPPAQLNPSEKQPIPTALAAPFPNTLPAPIPPTGLPVPAPAPTSTPISAPTAATASLSKTTTPTALDNFTVSEPSTKISSPPALDLAQSLAQALPPSRPDAAPQRQPGPAAPVSAPQETPGPRSPKRPRSPDGVDDSAVKRQKTDQTGPRQDTAMGAPNLDLAAMLTDALASFDQHAPPTDSNIIMQDADPVRPAAPPSTTLESEKAENKIMEASSNPFYVMRSMSLPVLGNIAVQILLRLSQQPRAETESLLADASSEFRKAYDMLRDIFRPTRRAFSDSPLLSPDELDITDFEDRETIRMSNLAATAASVFGAHDVSALDVHDAFFSIFIPEDGEYKSSLTDLLVSLKTRLLLDALNKPEQSQPVSQLLDTLFPVNFEDSLRQRSGDLLLNSDEEGLVTRIRERREQLVKSAADESIKKSLEGQSSPAKFAESLSIFLQSHLATVVDYAEKYGVNIPLNDEEPAIIRDLNSAQEDEHDNLAALLQSATSHLVQSVGDDVQGKDTLSNGIISEQLGSVDEDRDSLALKKLIEESLSNHIPELKDPSSDQHASAELSNFDSKNLASFISEKLKNELGIPTHGLPNLPTPAHAPSSVHSQFVSAQNPTQPSTYQSYTQGSTSTAPVGANGDHLPPNQSMPTAALYEKARQAAVAKSSNTTRREGLHSTRRPWTPEEEKALMAGLDMVKGPHWSQILSLFGQHGTISDILKDRTQVQLKDKARNLKLFFLKTNSEMPYYLQSVTGELKTRAPGQAARKEAEEKARMNLEEEQARIQGIMTLAGGLQNNHHTVSNSQLATSPKRASPATPSYGGTSAGAAATTTHIATSNGTHPTMPMPPRIKTELPDQHALSKVTAFPPIQPAPASGSGVQQARAPLPPLQPQPGLQQQARPQAQQHYQQPQQLQQPRQQELQKAPMAQSQQQQQQRQPLSHHSQGQQLSQSQSQAQPQLQAQPQQQPQIHQQAQSQLGHPPARTLPGTQAVPQPPLSAPRPSALQQTQKQTQASPTSHSQPLPTPPIPPNHHSTPDHVQDARLIETLQAAIAASTANETHVPLATVVSEGSAALN